MATKFRITWRKEPTESWLRHAGERGRQIFVNGIRVGGVYPLYGDNIQLGYFWNCGRDDFGIVGFNSSIDAAIVKRQDAIDACENHVRACLEMREKSTTISRT